VGTAIIIEPAQAVLEPVSIIPLRKIFARMGAAAFCAPDRRVQADSCLREHVVEFERLSEIAVELIDRSATATSMRIMAMTFSSSRAFRK